MSGTNINFKGFTVIVTIITITVKLTSIIKDDDDTINTKIS